MDAKFNFYEIVQVKSTGRLKKFNGLKCIIRGRSYDDNAGWAYAIDVEGEKYGSCAFEYELEETGKFANPEDFKSVGTIRVQVQPDGSGKIIEDDY